MKTSLRFLLGSLLLILICSATSDAGVSHKAPKPDTYQYGFGYTVTADPVPNVYDLTLYFLKLDVTNFTWVVTPCPAAITVTCSYGPKIGTIDFPAGVSSVSLGNTTAEVGSEYTISTSPTTLNGLTVYQEAFVIEL